MILFGLALLASIIAGALIGWAVMHDTGYVLVAYGDTAIETSLWVGLAIVVLGWLALRFTVALIRRILESQGKVSRWRSGRRGRKARQNTVRGLLLMAEGRWEESRKALIGAVRDVETPLINYLNAARAAHELGEAEQRDTYLKRAHETTPGAKFASMLSQAEFRINDGSYEQALAALLELRKRAPKHKAVLRMLAQCYEVLGDWQALHEQLRDLTDLKAISDAEVKRLSRLVWADLLRKGSLAARDDATDGEAAKRSEPDVPGLWKRLPRYLKDDAALMREWLDHLLAADASDSAEELVRLILGHTWSAEFVQFVQMYGRIHSSDIARQIVVAQKWLKERPQDVDLMLTLGRLCIAGEQYEKAREYLDTALRIEPRQEIYAELGRVCIVLGDEKRGTDYLLLSVGDLPAAVQPQERVAADPA